MKASGSITPVTGFAIAPNPPAAVVAAKAKFDDVSAKYTAVKDELKAARQAVKDAQAADITAAADAYAAGTEPTDRHGHEQAAADRLRELEAVVEALDMATDQTGNELAVEIAAARDQWTVDLAKAEAAAAKKFDAAMAAARDALAVLRPTRGAVQWLANFDAGKAAGGRVGQFSGGQLRVRVAPGRMEDPGELLRLAQLVTAPRPVLVRDGHQRLTPDQVEAAKAKREPVGHA